MIHAVRLLSYDEASEQGLKRSATEAGIAMDHDGQRPAPGVEREGSSFDLEGFELDDHHHLSASLILDMNSSFSVPTTGAITRPPSHTGAGGYPVFTCSPTTDDATTTTTHDSSTRDEVLPPISLGSTTQSAAAAASSSSRNVGPVLPPTTHALHHHPLLRQSGSFSSHAPLPSVYHSLTGGILNGNGDSVLDSIGSLSWLREDSFADQVASLVAPVSDARH